MIRRVARIGVAAELFVLALGHISFAIPNFGYVERLPENLDVLFEGVGDPPT